MQLFKDYVSQLWSPSPGESFRGLTIFPVYRSLRWNAGDQRSLCYVILHDAVANEQAVVTEMPSAHVPELLIKNQGPTAVLGLDGDELVGGRQNRILNVSVLLAHGESPVPVSCVERGRWREDRSPHFKSGERLPYKMRSSSHGSVSMNLKSVGGHASDQRAIWRDIADEYSRHGSHSSTDALNDWYKAQDEVLAAYQKHFPYPEHAVGLVVGIGDQIVSCDVFDQPKTANYYWPRLIRACVSEARQASVKPPSQAPDSLFKAAARCKIEEFKSPGLGIDVRLSGEGISGSALVHDGVVVHLSLFAQEVTA